MADDTKSSRSGTEKRKRQRLLQLRLTDAELAEIEAMANRAALTPSSYARSVLLDAPPPRARRRPTIEAQAVARMLGELGKVGSNLNQIAHALNRGEDRHPSDIADALADVATIRAACLEALGRKA
jgi:hypothetical protein